MKKLITICAIAVLMLAVSPAAMALVTVDPDAFAVGTDISNAFSGVTLSSIGPGFDNDFDPRIFSIDPLAWPGPFNASTGSLVFGTNDDWIPNVFSGTGDGHLRIDFSVSALSVSLDAIGNNDHDYARLDAYDASNTLIDSYSTGNLPTSIFETMTVSGNISYVVARGVSGDTVGFDNLNFQPIPAPGAILLGSIGVGLVGWLRRRRTL